MFTIIKAFVALMAATAVAAAPNKRQSFDDVTCTFVMSPYPTVPPGSIDLLTEFKFVIRLSLNERVPTSMIDGSTISITPNNDNTFTVVRSDGVDGLTAVETAAILTGLVGTSNNGFANNREFNWTFDSVSCDA